MTPLVQRDQRIVFIGDSITDARWRNEAPPYGDGYVSLVRAFVVASRPELNLTWFNRGIGGDTVRHLRDRWQQDALDLQPDVLSVMIGINDVWRLFDDVPENAVPIDEYESTLRDLLRTAVDATGCRLILAEPYIIEPDRDEPQRAMSDRYGAVVRQLAGEFDAVLVRTQQAFDRVLADTKPEEWSGDRIHPNLAGHAVIAQAFLEAAFGWQIPQ
jgi:lysophospholipase L1-like esterase